MSLVEFRGKGRQLQRSLRQARKMNIIQDKNKNPPKTQRWCLNCKDYRTFEYQKLIGHSRCMSCGSSYSMKLKPDLESEFDEACKRVKKTEKSV